MKKLKLLSTIDVARFAARGFLRFDAAVADEINAQFMAEAGEIAEPAEGGNIPGAYRDALASNAIPEVRAGTPLACAYEPETALARLLALPLVAGTLQSLLGREILFDHHFL